MKQLVITLGLVLVGLLTRSLWQGEGWLVLSSCAIAYAIVRAGSAHTRLAAAECDLLALREALENVRPPTPAEHSKVTYSENPPLQNTGPLEAVATDEPISHAPLLHPEPEAISQREWQAPDAGATASASAEEAPSQPAVHFVETLVARARDWFLGGNPIVKVGILLLFVGVAFLLKYAADHALLPIELRLAGVAAGSMVLLALGWRLRQVNPVYGLSLQGGAVGGLYLTIFATFRLYDLLPATLAFALLALVAVFAGVLAVLQNAMTLAMLGSVGGFVAPVLASTGSGSHIQLFNYFLLLNLGILGLSWFKSWRPLNVLSFLLTFGLGGLWAVGSYQPEYLVSAEIYLIIFSLLYLAIPILFAFRPSQSQHGIVDGSLVFGLPTVAASLQALLFADKPMLLAISAVCAGALYFVLAWLLIKRLGTAAAFMAQAFLAIALVFSSLALPLALDPRTTAGLWALEGAGLLWLGSRQQQFMPRVFGYLLQAAAWVSLYSNFTHVRPDTLPFINGFSMAAAMVAPAALYAAWKSKRETLRFSGMEALYPGMLIAAGWWWAVAWGTAAATLEHLDTLCVLALVSIVTIAVLDWLRGRLPWPDMQYAGRALLPVCVLMLLSIAGVASHPMATPLWLLWVLAAVVHLRVLRSASLDIPWNRFMHIAALWVLLAIIAWEVEWLITRFITVDPVLAVVVVGAVLVAVLWLFSRHSARMPWPVRAEHQLYAGHGMVPVVALLLAGVVFTSLVGEGRLLSLPYLPLLNFEDLYAIGAGVAIAAWWWREPRVYPYSHNHKVFLGTVLLIAFIWINSVWLKTAVYWLGESRHLHDQLRSQQVQTGLSILWSLVGLGAMFIGTRRGLRVLWFGGVIIMAAVVVKLLLIDLSSSGSIARIVSFIGVGGLLLVVGYFSPIPPERVQEKEPEA